MTTHTYEGWFAEPGDPLWRETLLSCPATLPVVPLPAREGDTVSEYAFLIEPESGGPGIFYYPWKRDDAVFDAWLQHKRPMAWSRARLHDRHLTLLESDGSERRVVALKSARQLGSLHAALGFAPASTAMIPPGTRRDMVAIPRGSAAGLALLRDLLRCQTADGGALVLDLRVVPVHVVDARDPSVLRRTSGLRFSAMAHDIPMLVPEAASADWSAMSARIIEAAPAREPISLFRVCRESQPDPAIPPRNGGAPRVNSRDTTQVLRNAPVCLVEWGASTSGLRWQTDDLVTPPGSVPDASPVWRAFGSQPMAWVPLDESRAVGGAMSLSVPWVRLADASRSATTSTERLAFIPPFHVPFRLLPAPQRAEPRAWLLNRQHLATLREVFSVQPAARLDGFELAAVPALDACLVQRHHGDEYIDIPGEPLAPLPGCPRVLVPVNCTLRPRVNPVRLPALLRLPADVVTLLLPATRANPVDQNGNSNCASATGMPYDRVELRRSAFAPMSTMVTFALDLELSPRSELEVPELLDQSVFEHPRHWAWLAHRAWLDMRHTDKAAAGASVHAGEQGPAPRPSVQQVPEPEPAPAVTTERRKRRTASKLVVAPVQRVEPDALVVEERRVEEQLAEMLIEPANPALRPVWAELAEIKRQREKAGEALFCQVNATWFPQTDDAGLDELRDALQRLASSTSLAGLLDGLSPLEALRGLEAAATFTAEHFICLWFIVESARDDLEAGATPEPELVIALQRFLGRLRGVLPYKLRWLLALSVSRLADDDIALEREREDLLGELNLRGLTVQNLESLVSALLSRRGALRSPAAAQSPGRAGVASTRWASDEMAGPGEKWARAWPPEALTEWVTVISQTTNPNPESPTNRGRDSTVFYIALGEMLLTVGRHWGQKHLPLDRLHEMLGRERSMLLGPLVRTHLREFDGTQPPEESERLNALQQFLSVPEDDGASSSQPRRFADFSPDLRTRIARYVVLLSQRWVSPAVRDLWRQMLADETDDTMLDLVCEQPRHWFSLLGYGFITDEFLPRAEAMAEDVRSMKPIAQAQLLRVMNEAASVCLQRNLPQLLSDDLPLTPVAGDEAASRLLAAFEIVAPKLFWERDADRLGPELARLEFLDAPALQFAWRDPKGPSDWRWLQGFARLQLSSVARLCRRDERNAALEMVEVLVDAWRRTYPPDDKGFSLAARSHVKWLVRGVLDVLPLIGNRSAGVRLINICLEHGRSSDTYTRSELYSAAARALALLGERSEAEATLTRILQAVDESVADDLLMFEVVEQVVTAALELLEPAVFRRQIARVARLLASRHFHGSAGAFYRKQLMLHINFMEWSLDSDIDSVPRLKPFNRKKGREDDEDMSGLDEAGVRDHALYWARQYLQARAYERDDTVSGWFRAVQDFIGRNKENIGALARDQLQALTDHFLGEAAAEHKALHDFRRQEETLIRNRIAWERLS